jgi:hypothetical protein
MIESAQTRLRGFGNGGRRFVAADLLRDVNPQPQTMARFALKRPLAWRISDKASPNERSAEQLRI